LCFIIVNMLIRSLSRNSACRYSSSPNNGKA